MISSYLKAIYIFLPLVVNFILFLFFFMNHLWWSYGIIHWQTMRSIPQVSHHDYISSQPILKSYSPFFNSSNQINITISTKMDKMESRGEVHEPLLRSIPEPEPIYHYHELDFQAWKYRHQLRLLQAPRLASRNWT
jgi:hypothetical protein